MLSRRIITGCEIICNQVVNVNLMIPACRFFLLKGIVFGPLKEPLPNAAIEVIRRHRCQKYKDKSIGVTFTKEDGSYGIALPIYPDYDYVLLAYTKIDSHNE